MPGDAAKSATIRNMWRNIEQRAIQGEGEKSMVYSGPYIAALPMYDRT
jgi:hypothetical protein